MRFVSLFLLTIFLNSCSPTLWVDKEPNIQLNKFKTFGWNEVKDNTGHTYYNKKAIDKTLQTAIDKSFSKKGYKVVPEEMADFFIDYHIYIEEDYYEETYCPTGFYGDSGYSPNLFPGPRCEVPERVRVFDSGTLVLDIIDKQTGQLVWRGNSFDVIDNPLSAPKILERRAKQIVNRFVSDARDISKEQKAQEN